MKTCFTIGVIFAFMAVIAAGHNPAGSQMAALFGGIFLVAAGAMSFSRYMDGDEK